jgi:hypothetical protein
VSTPASEDLRQKPTAELVGQLGSEISTLVRQEMELAKVTVRDEIDRASTRLRDDIDDAREEMSAKAQHAGKAAALAVAAAVAAILALGTLTAFLVLALDGAVDNWLAALIIGLVWVAATVVLLLLARAESRRIGSVAPHALDRMKQDALDAVDNIQADVRQSAESIKEDVQWARTQSGSESR